MDMKLQLNSCPLKVGDRLKIEGIVPADAYRFVVDLGCDGNNLGLHVSVRFDQNAVILNTCNDGCWAEEEKISPVLLRKNVEVKIVVKLLGDKFEVDFPDKQGVTLRNRRHMNDIPYVGVQGDFKLTSFEIM